MPRPGIIIVGPPRSGTTLLRRLIDAHPNIACPPETYVFTAAARFLHHERFGSGVDIGVLGGLGLAGFEDDAVIGRLREFAFGFLREYAQRQGKPRWAEKTAFSAFHLPAIRRLCRGHVQFICLQRNGLDAVLSLAELVDKTGGYVAELHAHLRQHADPQLALAHAWVEAANAVADLADGENDVLDLRYEDLVAHPDATLRRVLSFLDEPWHEGLVETALTNTAGVGFGDWKTYGRAKIDASSVGRQSAESAATIASLVPVCGPTLERLGYPVPTVVSRSPTDAQARRRYELGLLVNRMHRPRDPE
ncbi:MAG: sulfotransferase [Myxococcales bacterium FL481]|nr:MAG: sulfotransferase [Myxococcales bacterium FL481]